VASGQDALHYQPEIARVIAVYFLHATPAILSSLIDGAGKPARIFIQLYTCGSLSAEKVMACARSWDGEQDRIALAVRRIFGPVDVRGGARFGRRMASVSGSWCIRSQQAFALAGRR